MAETETDKEPSIEEILESIRQIISEDDGTAQVADAAQADAPAAAAVAEPAAPLETPPPAKADDLPVLELTDKVEPQMDTEIDLPAQVEPEAPAAAPEPVPAPAASTDDLISSTAADASASAMAKLLVGNVAVESDVPGRVGQVTLEDMAKEMMRPLIKTWLDQNLPSVIEKMVQKEIERISRKAINQ